MTTIPSSVVAAILMIALPGHTLRTRRHLVRTHIAVGVPNVSDQHAVRDVLARSIDEHRRVDHPPLIETIHGDDRVTLAAFIWVNADEDVEKIESDIRFALTRRARRMNIDICGPEAAAGDAFRSMH